MGKCGWTPAHSSPSQYGQWSNMEGYGFPFTAVDRKPACCEELEQGCCKDKMVGVRGKLYATLELLGGEAPIFILHFPAMLIFFLEKIFFKKNCKQPLGQHTNIGNKLEQSKYVQMRFHSYSPYTSGAEEEEEGDNTPIVVPSRTLPKMPPTSDAPRTEKTTLKMQTKVPTQTKVCAGEEPLAGF